MELWFNKFNDSNSYLRITLWNSLGFPIYYFSKVEETRFKNKITNEYLKQYIDEMQENPREYKYLKLLNVIDNKELNKLAEYIIEGKTSTIEDIDASKKENLQLSIYK